MRVKQTAREWSVTTVSPSINVSSRFSLSLQEELRSADCRVQRRPPHFSPPSRSVSQAFTFGLSRSLCNRFRFDFPRARNAADKRWLDKDTCALR